MPQVGAEPSTVPTNAFAHRAHEPLRDVLSQISRETSSLISVAAHADPALSDRRSKNDLLTNAISNLEDILEDFDSSIRSEIANLKRQLNARIPLMRLPNEILVEIFHFYILASQTEVPAKMKLPLQEDYTFPIKLTHVCSAWRTLAMATPRLWSSIDMDWPLPIIEMFSSRCQPISSDIVWNNTGTSDTGKASFLIGNVSKMVSLKLMLPLHLMPEPEGLFRSHEILPLPLPDMTNLTLSFPRSDIGELDDNLFAGNAPRLVDLCLLNVSGSFSPQIFRGLLYLRIYYTACKSSHVTHKLPLCDVIDLLRASPELRIFQFSVSDWDCTITATTSVPHFVAEKLQTVILDGWDRAAIKMFFTKVSSPSLTSLKIEAAPTMGEVEEIEENNMLCFLDDAPESVQSLLSRGRHLVVHNPPGSETATFSLSTTGSLVTHTPSVVLRTSAPEEHDWREWIKGLYRTIPQLNLYLDLSQLRTFAFNYNGESRVSLDAISHLSCWREFLSQCVALEEIEIVGPDSWKPILRALGNIPILEENVPCPSLRVLRLVMPSVPEDPVLFEALWMRKKSGKRISQLIFMPYLPEHGGYEYDMLEYSESSERLEMLEMVVETTRRIPRNSRETVLGGKDAYETLPDEEDRLAFW